MPGCKPGDLAKFIPGHRNEGRMVEVLQKGFNLRDFTWSWEVQPLQPLWQCLPGDRWKFDTTLQPGLVDDCYLIPIRPGDLDVVDQHKEPACA